MMNKDEIVLQIAEEFKDDENIQALVRIYFNGSKIRKKRRIIARIPPKSEWIYNLLISAASKRRSGIVWKK